MDKFKQKGETTTEGSKREGIYVSLCQAWTDCIPNPIAWNMKGSFQCRQTPNIGACTSYDWFELANHFAQLNILHLLYNYIRTLCHFYLMWLVLMCEFAP